MIWGAENQIHIQMSGAGMLNELYKYTQANANENASGNESV